MTFRFGDIVEYKGEMYKYIGVEEDGTAQLVSKVPTEDTEIIESNILLPDELTDVNLFKKSFDKYVPTTGSKPVIININ